MTFLTTLNEEIVPELNKKPPTVIKSKHTTFHGLSTSRIFSYSGFNCSLRYRFSVNHLLKLMGLSIELICETMNRD